MRDPPLIQASNIAARVSDVPQRGLTTNSTLTCLDKYPEPQPRGEPLRVSPLRSEVDSNLTQFLDFANTIPWHFAFADTFLSSTVAFL